MILIYLIKKIGFWSICCYSGFSKRMMALNIYRNIFISFIFIKIKTGKILIGKLN